MDKSILPPSQFLTFVEEKGQIKAGPFTCQKEDYIPNK